MTALKVIWAEPGMPGYTDEPCASYTVRYIHADTPELGALVATAKAVLAVDKDIGTRSTVHDMLENAIAAYEALK